MSFSSSPSSSGSVTSPGSCSRGARLDGVAKRALPRPPCPPLAMTTSAPASSMSARTSPVSLLRMMVPSGTLMTRFWPRRPCMSLLRPSPPFSAEKWRLKTKSDSVSSPVDATKMTSPPSPPSPPLGPPFGTNASRRKLQQPLPPFPALTVISARSTNIRDSLK